MGCEVGEMLINRVVKDEELLMGVWCAGEVDQLKVGADPVDDEGDGYEGEML